MAAALTPEDLKKKEVLKKAAREQESAPAGMPAFLQPQPSAPAAPAAPVVVAAPDEAENTPAPAAAPVVVVPVEKEEPR